MKSQGSTGKVDVKSKKQVAICNCGSCCKLDYQIEVTPGKKECCEIPKGYAVSSSFLFLIDASGQISRDADC